MAAEHDDQVGSADSRVMHALSVPGIAIAGAAVLGMMFIGTADIAGTLIGYPIPGALELTQALMVIVIFLALPQVEARREQISVDMVVQRLGARARKVLGIVVDLLGLVYFAAMAWQGWLLFLNSWRIREYAPGSIAFPIYPSKALFAIGVTLVCVVLLVHLHRALLPPSSGTK